MEYVSEFVTWRVASNQCSRVPINVLTNQLQGNKRTRIYLNFLGNKQLTQAPNLHCCDIYDHFDCTVITYSKILMIRLRVTKCSSQHFYLQVSVIVSQHEIC